MARSVLLALAILAWAHGAGLVICPRCGYENGSEQAECTHCGAALPRADGAVTDKPPEAVSGHRFTDDGEFVFLDPAVAAEELRLGVEYARSGQTELALFFLRNAGALDQITDPQQAGERPREALNWTRRCLGARGTVERPCPVCEGTGKRTMKMTSLTGGMEREMVTGVCPRCRGSGTVAGRARISEIKLAMGQAERMYRKVQQGRKYAPLGEGWIPGELEGKLSARQQAAVKRAAAGPCDNCVGLGRVECDRCRGTGEVKCPNKCQMGKVRVTIKTELTKTAMHRTETCKVCGGRGSVACEACQGTGAVVCDECQGSGQRATCPGCDGQGFVACRRCKGTGVYRGQACPECLGRREVLCPACKGDGRKR